MLNEVCRGLQAFALSKAGRIPFAPTIKLYLINLKSAVCEKFRSATLISQVFYIEISAKKLVEKLAKIFLSKNESQFTKKISKGYL
jgi:hypothetical protein